ncbi:response regulator transcription factor [Amnibacterium kyonggiense]|uniref:LuxR family two component transcriptional regulator n=1 Tax=Amnibacterium kyonggiense TaxID=595671 RepID=A0A4R7FPS0_9MICO|nr:response regulator transcription factor [Amnibacterium kyonggiense]TDS79569.1 LuxR family two component transcriptional regulator [Amnibacterium kyonggiense]
MDAVLTRPLTVALVDDYDVVLIGLAHLFDDHRDRVVVAEIDANARLDDRIDVVLYDSFAQPESDHEEVAALLRSDKARRVAVYTWNFHPELVEAALAQGVHGYLSKSMSAEDLVDALERIHGGETVVTEVTGRVRSTPALDWPGKAHGLTDRESEILALITQGKSNAEVAALTYLSPNTVKSYIRAVYRKIGADSRTRAVLWGVANGFAPDHHRIDHWLGGP